MENLAVRDEICGLIDQETIEKEFDVTLTQPLGGGLDQVEEPTVGCDYVDADADDKDLNDFFTLQTRVSVVEDAASVEEVLDEYFVELVDGTPVDYERIDGPGDGAGYAQNFGLNDNVIVVVLDVDDTLFEVVVDVKPDGAPEQLRPVAVELVDGLEARLR